MNSTIQPALRKACGVIPFRDFGAVREYLIVLQSNHIWCFPKGHMEPGETETETALRELREETALTAQLLPDRKAVSEYDISPDTRKRVVFFLGKAQGTVTTREGEILSHLWVPAAQLKNYLHPDTYAACRHLLYAKGLL